MNRRLASLDDWLLFLELRDAQNREATCREDCRNNRSHYRGEELFPLLCEAESYVRECVDEIERRKQQGKWNPDPKDLFRVFPKFQSQPAQGSPPRATGKVASAPSEHERDPEGTKIIVENGALRASRPGDLVHEPKKKK